MAVHFTGGGGGSSGGGATLSEMYQSARRMLLSARDGVARVKRLASAPSSSSYSSAPLVEGVGDPAAAGDEVRLEVTQIRGLCTQMDRLWRSIPAKGQRDLWKRKVEHLSEEVDSLKETLERHSLRQKKRILEAKERTELFERANGESSHVLRIFDDEAQAMQSARIAPPVCLKKHMIQEWLYFTSMLTRGID